MRRQVLACVIALTAAPPAVAQIGSVLRSVELEEGSGGFTGDLDAGGGFGMSVAALGDLDADGVGDLIAGAPLGDDGGQDLGAVWVVFLDADGSAVSQTKISQIEGGFTGALGPLASFGLQVAGIGDLDRDDVPDAAVTSKKTLWILFLNPDGTVKGQRAIQYTDPVFVPATTATFFGGLAALGDLDGDGLGDLAVGCPEDDDGNRDAGAIWILYLNANGSPRVAQKISQTEGGLGPILARNASFGSRIVRLGDLDGDDELDLGVSAPGLTFGGTYFTLFLDADQLVLRSAALDFRDFHIGRGSILYGLGGEFGAPGDLDGDGAVDLAVGSGGWSFPPEPASKATGGIALSFLTPAGGHSRRLLVSSELNGMPALANQGGFGSALASLGDLDGDGSIELAVGAGNEHQGTGAVWILSLDPSAVRNGSGANPLTLGQGADPVIGTLWSATLDCSAHGNGLAVLVAFDRPLSGLFLRSGELLVDVVSGNKLFTLVVPHGGAVVGFAAAVPNDVALVNLQFSIQGLCTGSPAARLSNALDVLVGR